MGSDQCCREKSKQIDIEEDTERDGWRNDGLRELEARICPKKILLYLDPPELQGKYVRNTTSASSGRK
jgi:hypothetical protein